MPTNRFATPRLIELEIPKGDERFRFVFRDTPRGRMLAKRTARRWAADPELWFTSLDAETIEEVVG